MNPRLIAIHVLHAIIVEKKSLSNELHNQLNFIDNPSDRGFSQEIILGTLRYYPSLKKTLEQQAKKPISNKNKVIEIIACSAIYQLIILNKPSYAVINESVNLSKQLDISWAKNFLNAVLRKIAAQQSSLDEDTSSSLIIDNYHDHPKWLWQKLKTSYPNYIDKITTHNHHPASMMLRLCKSCIQTREEYLELLSEQNILAFAHPDNKDCIVLNHPITVKALPLFDEGHITIQDANAQLAANLLGIKKGQIILDACAAPGGKTAHIADKAEDLNITAVDLSSVRISKMQDTFNRLNHNNITCLTEDVQLIDDWHNGKLFDRILLDVPCSAIGVIRKHPDILFHRTEDDIKNLMTIQQNILTKCWPYLVSGGKLLYATCSILPEENSMQIQTFLDNTPNAKIIPLGHNRAIDNSLGCLQFLPDDYGDGFFYALLEKEQ